MRNHYYISILAFLLSLISGKEVYAWTWVSLDGTQEGQPLTIEVLESGLNAHNVRMTIHGFFDDKIVKDGTEYHQPYLDMYEWLMYEGEPQLPTLHQTIAIPEGADFKITIKEEKWTDVERGKIYPAQRDVKENDPEPPFTIKERAYQQDVYAPVLVTTGTEWNWCNIRGNTVHVCPFRYYPLNNKLSVLTDFVLKIEFTECSDKSPVLERDLRRAIDWHMFDNDISGFPVKSDMAKSSPDDYDYLIIVGNIPSILNSQAMQNFTKWKAFKGYKTKVVSTVTTGATPDSIKNYISNERIKGIKYVLLVGDYDKVPSKYFDFHSYDPSIRNYFDLSDTVKSDYWYGCLDVGYDYKAELPIGRFSTNSCTEFTNMVQKTIDYEKAYNGNYQNVLLVAHKEGAPYKYQGCCEEIRTTPYNVSMCFSTAYGAKNSVSIGGNEATNDSVVNHINNGMHIVNYRGHGEDTHWGIETFVYGNKRWNIANELFQASQINNISSNSIYFNACCLTGNIYYGTCMMETFMRSQKGAIACLAASKDTYTTENHEYDKCLFSKLLNSGVSHIGYLNLLAHNTTISTYIRASFNAYASICGGDPSLDIWTGTPNYYDNVTVNCQDGNITIYSPSFCFSDTISIVTESGVLIDKLSASGNTCSFSIPSGNFYAVANRHNYYPYVIYFYTGDYIQNESIDVDLYYAIEPTKIGYDVTTEIPYGNVTVNPGSKLFIQKGTGGMTIKNGFECKTGAELIIQ